MVVVIVGTVMLEGFSFIVGVQGLNYFYLQGYLVLSWDRRIVFFIYVDFLSIFFLVIFVIIYFDFNLERSVCYEYCIRIGKYSYCVLDFEVKFFWFGV